MLGVDRLDMIKGIPQKILAFEKFLEENPYWRDRVVLLQIAVPTRTDVPECKLPPPHLTEKVRTQKHTSLSISLLYKPNTHHVHSNLVYKQT